MGLNMLHMVMEVSNVGEQVPRENAKEEYIMVWTKRQHVGILLAPLLAGQDLHQANATQAEVRTIGPTRTKHKNSQDVNHIKFEADRLVYRVALHDASFGKPSVLKDLLGIKEDESTKDGEATIQRNAFTDGEGTETHG